MQKNRGSALITALFIVTIVAIIVTSMTSRLRLDIYQTNLMINNDKLYLASKAVTFWAVDQISQANKPLHAINNQGKVLTFPSNYQHIYPNITINGAVYDLQARFNLNNLLDETYKPIFFALIKYLYPKLNKRKNINIVNATTNWINGIKKGQVSQDEWLEKYLYLQNSYLPGYQKMQNISEFRTVFGVTAPIYNSLNQYISTLPELTLININTASYPLLYSLSLKPNKDKLEKIINLRKNKPIENLITLENLLKEANIPKEKLTTKSSYYLIVAHTQSQDLEFTNYITVKAITNNDKTIQIEILSESFNTE